MTTSFWKTLPQPIIGLAPMDGVTDSAFRYIVAAYGKPDVVFTEFTNVHDICSGRLKALDSLRYSEMESIRSSPKSMEKILPYFTKQRTSSVS